MTPDQWGGPLMEVRTGGCSSLASVPTGRSLLLNISILIYGPLVRFSYGAGLRDTLSVWGGYPSASDHA